MWWNAIAGVLGIGGDYLKSKAKLKQTKVEGEIDIVKTAAQDLAQWEQLHAKGSQTSWKDEFWTLIWAAPLIMCFIPGGVEYAKAGFAALAQMPEWYTYVLVTIVLASFGIRFTGKAKEMVDQWRK